MFFSSCRWSSVPWWTDSQSDKGEKIFRYDRLVDEFVSLNSFTSLQCMNTEYPAATRLLIEEVLAIGAGSIILTPPCRCCWKTCMMSTRI